MAFNNEGIKRNRKQYKVAPTATLQVDFFEEGKCVRKKMPEIKVRKGIL